MAVAQDYDALLLDLDGTIWEGGRAIPGAVEGVIASGLPAMYVTNNASRAPEAVAEQLRSIGLTAKDSDVLTSAQAAIEMVSDRIPAGSKVFVLGSPSFRALAEQAGFVVVDSADDAPIAVLQGHSPETGWAQLSEAALAIQRGAVYVASNLDTTLPQERGLMIGNGSMVAAVVSATGVVPDSAGKPGPPMFFSAAAKLGSSRPLAVGDRLNTDIAGGNAAGMGYVSGAYRGEWLSMLCCAPFLRNVQRCLRIRWGHCLTTPRNSSLPPKAAFRPGWRGQH